MSRKTPSSKLPGLAAGAVIFLLIMAGMAGSAGAGHPTATPFSDDMEGGPNGWVPTGSWHQLTSPETIHVFHQGAADAECPINDIYPDLVTLPLTSDPAKGVTNDNGLASLPTAFSGIHAWWYGVNANGTFIDNLSPNAVIDVNNDGQPDQIVAGFDKSIQACKNGGLSTAANGGSLTSPTIILSPLSSATLTFKTWFEIESVDAQKPGVSFECCFDQMIVEVSTDGGSTFTERGRLNPSTDFNGLPEQPFTSAGFNLAAVWISRMFDLTPYIGQNIKIRFTFNTGDPKYNGFRGWLIDDVLIQGVINHQPVAKDDAYTTAEDTILTVPAPGVLANDTDDENDLLTAILKSGPLPPSTVALSSDGSFSYHPEANFNGTDSFTYVARDGQSNSNFATVTITVTPVNDAPVANADSKTTAEDTPLSFPASDLTANDFPGPANEAGQTLTVTFVHGFCFEAAVLHSVHCTDKLGTVTLSLGNITYTPPPNFFGVDSFTYTVCDDGTTNGVLDSKCATGTVNLNVMAVNDPPVLAPIGDQNVPEGQALVFTVKATDVDSATFAFLATNLPTGATFNPPMFSWTPDSSQAGVYFVRFQVSDGSLSDNEEITITVNDTLLDTDLDGVPDAVDNCLNDPNPTQSDVDGDGKGDGCDNDAEKQAKTSGTSDQPAYEVNQDVKVNATVTVTSNADCANPEFAVRADPYNVILRLEDSAGNLLPPDQILEGGLLEVSASSLVPVCVGSSATFNTQIQVTGKNGWYLRLLTGNFTFFLNYVTLGVKDPDVNDNGNCTLADPTGCFRIIQVESPAGTGSFAVRNTPAAETELADLCSFIDGLSVDPATRRNLASTCKAASDLLAKRNYRGCCGKLDDLRRQVLASQAKLGPTQTAQLLSMIDEVKRLLACPK